MTTVTKVLEDEGLEFKVLHHARAETSIGEALTLGIRPEQVAKTVVLKSGERYVPMVIPASRRLDIRRAREALGDHHARLATEEEMREDFPGLELGAFPPVASLFGTPAYVDPEVLEHETIVFAAGEQTESVRMRTADLFPEGHRIVVPLTKGFEEAL